jgi:hypothetical protein
VERPDFEGIADRLRSTEGTERAAVLLELGFERLVAGCTDEALAAVARRSLEFELEAMPALASSHCLEFGFEGGTMRACATPTGGRCDRGPVGSRGSSTAVPTP